MMPPHLIEIETFDGPVDGVIRPPGSKSITNRALLIAALADGESVLTGVLNSDDTRVMIAALTELGIPIELHLSENSAIVIGCSGTIPEPQGELFCENSGTSIRFLTAVLAFAGGNYQLDGVERMRQRPIGPLVNALQSLGARIIAHSPQQCPPVTINSGRLQGGRVEISGQLSSQYISGMLMAAPLLAKGLQLEIVGDLVSQPYISMTGRIMNDFGICYEVNDSMTRWHVGGGQTYQAGKYTIEPDASAASYYWATAAICGGQATVTGLNRNSLQGDVAFVDALARMGCEVLNDADSITVVGPAKQGIEIDMSRISDTVQTLAAVSLFVSGTTSIKNVAHNRIKETDRIGDLAVELRKMGAKVDEFADGLTITPGKLQGTEIETYNDHRMAMSLSLVGLRVPNVKIRNPACVSKTYPDFFADWARFLGRPLTL